MKKRRNMFDKLNTLLFGKDLRITEGEPYTAEREYDYSSYCPVGKYVAPVSKPDKDVYCISDFGARANDTGFDNAPAINGCIEQCSRNGGGYVIISGGEFTARTVVLRSNVTLFVCADSKLTAYPDGSGFENKAFIYADGCENITVTGGGEINGNGHLFGRKPLLDSNLTEPSDVIDVIEMRRDYRAQLRFAHPSKYGRLVVIENSKNIKVENIILRDSAGWTLRATCCENFRAENVVIDNNRHVCNTDGIDLMQTSNAVIKHCFISCADDGIVLKNAIWEGCSGPMSNIRISDCEVISCTNSFKIGTETTYPISDVLVENCRFFMTDLYPGSVSAVSIESADGSEVSDITVRNIEADRCTCPLFIRLCNRNRAAKVDAVSASAIEYGIKKKGKGVDKKLFDMKGGVRNITVENLNADNIELPIIVAGYRQRGKVRRVENVKLKNINLKYRQVPEIIDRRLFIPEYSKEYPECWRFRNLPAYGIWARHVRHLKTENVSCVSAPHSIRKEKIFKDVI